MCGAGSEWQADSSVSPAGVLNGMVPWAYAVERLWIYCCTDLALVVYPL